ncbi:MAG: hypothetical protein ACD_19C00113G0001 [uncultured bacterium]|nr:MAG: hypothetical protein ACD_19C00113G0001 [uncultured bacterium]
MNNPNMDKVITIVLQILEVIGVLGATYYASKSATITHKSLVQQEKNEEPKLVVYVEQSKSSLSVINLIVRNEGIRSARKVKFKIIGDKIKILLDRTIGDIGLIKNGVSLLAGGKEITQPLGVMLGETFKEYKESNVRISVSYEMEPGNRKKDVFDLDFRGLVDVKVGKSEVEMISEPLEDIQNELSTMKQDLHLIANNGITELFAQPVYGNKHEVTEKLK